MKRLRRRRRAKIPLPFDPERPYTLNELARPLVGTSQDTARQRAIDGSPLGISW